MSSYVTETPAGISAAPLRYQHIPLRVRQGRQARRPTRSDGRARERQAGGWTPASCTSVRVFR